MKVSEIKIQRKKEKILMSAVKIVNECGYEGATMEEIAAELLMTKGSLYYYFKNKADLMYQCHNLVLSQATKELEAYVNEEGSAEEILYKMVMTHIDYAIEEKETFNLIIKPEQIFNKGQLEDVVKLRKHYAGLFDQIIERGLENGEFTIKEPILSRMFILGALNWIQQWFNPSGRVKKEELQTIFWDYILKLLK